MKKDVFILIIVMLFIASCGGYDLREGVLANSVDNPVVDADVDVEKTQTNIIPDSDSYFPLVKGLSLKYRNSWIDYQYYKSELVDITADIIDDGVRQISFEGMENIEDTQIPYEGRLTEYYKNENGVIKLYRAESDVNYYGADNQSLSYEINYAPAITFLGDDESINVGDKFTTTTQVTLYVKESGSSYMTYDFPARVIVEIAGSRMMLVGKNEVEVFEVVLKDAYNWSNMEEFCEKISKEEKYTCPSKKFKPKFLSRKMYLAKGIGPVRFVGEESIFGFGDWVGRASVEPIIDLVE